MQIQGAVIKEQGQAFAIVVVKPHVVSNPAEARRAITGFVPVFGGIPVVLMAQDSRGSPTYYGRPDIARFLSRTPISAIPWRSITIN
jgi:hypothetical protein